LNWFDETYPSFEFRNGHGYNFISHWTQAMRYRTLEDARLDVPRSSYIILDRVRSRVQDAGTESYAQQARRTAVSDGLRSNKLRVELIFPESPHIPLGKDPGYSTARPPRKSGERKRLQTDALLMGSESAEHTSADSG
jgi:hypothetical protein